MYIFVYKNIESVWELRETDYYIFHSALCVAGCYVALGHGLLVSIIWLVEITWQYHGSCSLFKPEILLNDNKKKYLE